MENILRVQSVSDLITNSSSEVFITDYSPNLPHGESWCALIDRDFMLRRNYDDAYCVWSYLNDKFGIDNPIDDHWINPDKPEELEIYFSLEDYRRIHKEDPKPNKHYMDIFDKFVEEHEELKHLMDGHHFVVSLSDHDDDYWDYDVKGELVFGH